MAPPGRILNAAARPSRSFLHSSSSSSSASTAFPAGKKDKRQIKRSNLISRITKPSTTSSSSSYSSSAAAAAAAAAAERNRRRRQKKQQQQQQKRLVANLESLADALPEDGVSTATAVVRGGRSGGTALGEQADGNLIHRRSMKSRPGALKRREKIDRGERERFARNLAEMSGKRTEATGEAGDGVNAEDGSRVHDRWTALRGFIARTMEQRPELGDLKS